jgi:hypothetical protein
MPIPIIALSLTMVMTVINDIILDDTEYEEFLSIGRVVHYGMV